MTLFTPDIIPSDQPCWLPWMSKSFFFLGLQNLESLHGGFKTIPMSVRIARSAGCPGVETFHMSMYPVNCLCPLQAVQAFIPA